MSAFQFLSPLFEAGNLGWTMLGLAVGLLGLSVVILARLHWIQSRPLAACVVLSVIAHGLLISAVHLTRMFDIVPPPGDAGIAVRLDDAPIRPQSAKKSELGRDETPVMPWEKLAEEPPPRPTLTPVPPLADVAPDEILPQKAPNDPAKSLSPAPLQLEAWVEKPVKTTEAAEAISQAKRKVPSPLPKAAAKIARSQNDRNSPRIPKLSDPSQPSPAANVAAAVDQPSRTADPLKWRHVASSSPSHQLDSKREAVPDAEESHLDEFKKVPARYQARSATNREQIAQRRGGSPETEAAVERALAWLVANQASDGRWDASHHAAGHGQLVEGHFRGAAGVQADTAITGLALLALLGAGHTHEQGEYKEAVSRGLIYLLRNQAADGNLSGRATNFARMYCHGIASLALCESLAMTNDERLRPYAERAIYYTLGAQHPTTGGWRYHPGDPGDTSQFGWQVMVLSSAEQAGLAVPLRTKQGMQRFHASVTNGSYRGLAGYRPGHSATRSMTAEALACRAFLGRADPRATAEASQFLVDDLPGRGTDDLYYWYYATLGLYLSDAELWPRWNTALTRRLLATQETDLGQSATGSLAGSWPPTTKWAGHGGRVYSTALSALCLEVYYRYAK